MNYAFLSMVIIGIIYIIVMLISGLFFFCCRFCGRCGAKNSQKQRHTDNCWRNFHKFCLIFMIAFLVVPIVCMCIINQHMMHSFPNVKGNVTEVFNIVHNFANDTDKDVDNALKEAQGSPIKNYEAFKANFVELVHENISSSIDHEKLEDIKNIVTWVLSVENQYDAVVNASILSDAVKHLKSSISSIREHMKSIHNCTNSNKKLCQLTLQDLPIERINIDDAYTHVHEEFQKLIKANFDQLRSVIDQIQNNTFLRNKIEQESESLKRFVEEATTDDKTVAKKIKEETKYYTDKMRKFSKIGKEELESRFKETDGIEPYRWWVMFGIALVLLLPVLLLTLGLVCGCCGHEKERHPTKRSSASNCAGYCFILAVYYFFLVSSVLMLATVALFIVGGNMQSFVCIPLYEEKFTLLDDITRKISTIENNTILQRLKPSKFLNDCYHDQSIIYAIGFLDQNDSMSYEKLLTQVDLMNEADSEAINDKLKSALLEITSGIREKLHQFTTALSLGELKEIPEKLQEFLRTSKFRINDFVHKVRTALEEEGGEDLDRNLLLVNSSAEMLYDEVHDFERKLNNFSSTLLNIYDEADHYQSLIEGIEDSLDQVEEKLPYVVKAQLFHAAAESGGIKDMVKNIGKCYPLWFAFEISRVAACDFVIYPVNGFWFALGWALVFIIPTIFFSVKLSRHYIRMKYDDDTYMVDCGEAVPLEDMSRTKPFSYTNPGAMSWMPQFNPHQNYMVHPTSNGQTRHFNYK
nr:prominin-1 isoform X1 [Parasteatoda tepidariorum]XP_042898381.1 prominin-1 isoform X2 [Parasteatoda tepidariorum]